MKISRFYLLSIIMFIELIIGYEMKSPIIDNTEFTASLMSLIDSLSGEKGRDSVEMKIVDNYEFAYDRFIVFNPNIDSAIVYQYAKVMRFYHLDTTDDLRRMYVGQILLESGAKQFREDGTLVVSSGGAIGICQIIPYTCFGYFTKYMDSTDVANFKNLGATDFSFAYDKSKSRSEKINLSREWLTNVNNNIIMWGFITKNNLHRNGTQYKQLISYNMGTGGMLQYIGNGGIPANHHYIMGIKKKLRYAEGS